MHYININGRIVPAEKAGVPVDNGAFRYGYGLFETILVKDGAVMLADMHLARLFDGLDKLGLHLLTLFGRQQLLEQILETVQKNGLSHLCRVRLQVYAGGGGIMGHEVDKAGFIIECFGLNAEAVSYNENGLIAGLVQGIAKSADGLANLKTCNALVYALAARQARAHKWNDALIANTAGNIIESTIANIFWVKDGQIFTPPLSEGCIAGVMRRYITNHAEVTERPLDTVMLMEADEVFLTNAIRRIKWVRTIGDKTYTNRVSAGIAARLFS